MLWMRQEYSINIYFRLYIPMQLKWTNRESMSEGLGCGDKHGVVDCDRNSAKHNNVNTGCRDITFIIRRYFRAAGTWRGVFEPSAAASDE